MADTKTTHLELIKQDPDTLPDHVKSDGNLDLIDAAVWARGRTFNGIAVSPVDGGFHVGEIPLSEDLKTFSAQSNTGDYIIRSTGGDASIKDGTARLAKLVGKNRHENYSEQSVSMVTAFVAREEGESISATIDEATFIATVSDASGEEIFTYTDEWDTDPADYGITVTGTPEDGDTITVTYAKEVRGTIYVSTPTSFISTGWNLFNYSAGYARVCKYSDEYGFKIAGAYTALAFAVSTSVPAGDRTEIEPDENGLFTIPSDGYVFVTGGNNTTTAIWMTWSDWINGYKWNPNTSTQGEFETYASMVNEVNFNTFMQSAFPNGLLSAGSVHDEINFTVGYAYKRVTRMAYSSSNLLSAIATGRQYEYDQNYIYLADATETQFEVGVNTQYTAYDHGMEMFSGTEQAVTANTSYGASLRNKLERDTLTISQQALSAAQKSQVFSNIGMADQIPSAEFTALTNLEDFTSRVETLMNAAPMKGIVGLGYIVWTNAANKIGIPFSGHVVGFGRQGKVNQRYVIVYNNAGPGMAVLRKTDNEWQTAWEVYDFTQTATVTSGSNLWTSGNILLYKRNGVVTVRLDGIVLGQISTNTKIGTLPVGYRPTVTVNCYCSQNLSFDFIMKLVPDGDIIVSGCDSGQKYGSATYVIP